MIGKRDTGIVHCEALAEASPDSKAAPPPDPRAQRSNRRRRLGRCRNRAWGAVAATSAGARLSRLEVGWRTGARAKAAGRWGGNGPAATQPAATGAALSSRWSVPTRDEARRVGPWLRHIDLKEDDTRAIAVRRLRHGRHDDTSRKENDYSRKYKNDCSHESSYRRSCCHRHRWASIALDSDLGEVVPRGLERRRRRVGARSLGAGRPPRLTRRGRSATASGP